MKKECPTYLKTIGKSKALAATLSDTEPEDESNDNDDKGILNAFTATVNPTQGIVEEVDKEEDLVESKFEKIDEQDDIHTAYAKLYKVSIDTIFFSLSNCVLDPKKPKNIIFSQWGHENIYNGVAQPVRTLGRLKCLFRPKFPQSTLD